MIARLDCEKCRQPWPSPRSLPRQGRSLLRVQRRAIRSKVGTIMETLVILAAAAATLLACVFVVTLSKGPPRPPLRLPREEEWADDADAVVKALIPSQPSPIDRGAQVLDARVLDDPIRDGDLIDGHVIDGETVDAPEGGEPRTFQAEELDSRMLDQLLDQQNQVLKQTLEPDPLPPSEAKDRAAR
ncbi:hypothetical protein Y590_23215 [Methylobacterium sp. AMS5]|nr:hypothetical protein Y590_23215 [Methylobacterium sp. AMS5]